MPGGCRAGPETEMAKTLCRCCWHNAVSETFIKTLKAELIWRHPWRTRQQLTDALFKYINGFYNIRTRHSSLGGISPAQFEQQTAEKR
ncbi:IS3 family transposase [Agrobacterium vitis]|nr:IS3 family transposase [Allorhizobium ampelinum]